MSLTAEEQELYEVARRALPSWYAPDDAINEQLYAKAKIAGQAEALDRDWLGKQAFLLTAEGATATTPDWLGEHARDLGTSRQNGESDAALRARLRSFEESITPAGLQAAAQTALTAAGVAGTVAMLELPKDQAFFQTHIAQTGGKGTFAVAGANFKFTLDDEIWYGGRPPYQNNTNVDPDVTYKLVITGATSAANNGTFTIIGIDGDGVVYSNGSGVPGVDNAVNWQVDRYWHDGSFLTETSSRPDAYFDRGYRMGNLQLTVVLILPFGTSEAVRLSVAEKIRPRKPAGVRLLVERREIP